MNTPTPDHPRYLPSPVDAWEGEPPEEYWQEMGDHPTAALWVWTVYQDTVEAPGRFIVRPFLIGELKGVPISYTGFITDTLEWARGILMNMGLAPFDRDENDPPEIVESWM